MKRDVPQPSARAARPTTTAARTSQRRVVPEGIVGQRKAGGGVAGKSRGREELGAVQERLEASERLVEALRAEVEAMKEVVERMRSLNVELEIQNRQYESELNSAQVKISQLQEVTVEKLNECQCMKKSEPREIQDNKIATQVSSLEQQSTQATSTFLQSGPTKPRPPPPPPPPVLRQSRAVAMQKAPSLVEFYHSLTKRGREKIPSANANCSGAVDSRVHTSIVGEIQNRSAHLLAIKADVETKADFINFLIEKVRFASFNDMEVLSNFVDWLDGQLSKLADERAVLKHFNWPEKKADAMREAAIEYRALKRLENEVHLFQDDPSLSFELALKKMASLLEKLEKSIQRLIKLRDATFNVYREARIPTDWMMDTGAVSKIKAASMKLAKVCMRRVSIELESIRQSECDVVQESVLVQCVRFAYRVHQFAGGLDKEAMSVFEELRRRISFHSRGSSKLLMGIVVN